jgi:hypothetical protein
VLAGGALETGQVGSHCQPQLISERHRTIGRDGRQFREGHHAQTLRLPSAVAKPAKRASQRQMSAFGTGPERASGVGALARLLRRRPAISIYPETLVNGSRSLTNFPRTVARAKPGKKRVLRMANWAEIRRLRRSEQIAISPIARVLGISRKTVKAAVARERQSWLTSGAYTTRGDGSTVCSVVEAFRQVGYLA